MIALLSGCAKVTQEAAPCVGARPPKAYVQDAVIYAGGYGTVSDLTTHSATAYFWKGPNNFSQTTSYGSLDLSFYSTTNYGMYTVSYVYNGCSSDPDTFYVQGSAMAAPPCTISSSNYNNLVASYGNNFNTTGGTLSAYYGCSDGYDINSGTTSGYTFDMYTITSPVSGGYFDLTSYSSICYLSNSQAYVALSGAGTTYYQSVSGRAYINVINGVKYITFCNATFQRTSDGLNFTMTGKVSYH